MNCFSRPILIMLGLLALCFLVSPCSTDTRSDLLSSLKVVDLPFPPGERNVIWLTVTSDKRVRGLTSGKKWHKFLYDPQTGQITIELAAVETNIAACLRNESAEIAFLVTETGQMRTSSRALGQVAGTRPFENNGYQVSRALVRDAQGDIFTAGKDGFLFRYSLRTNKLEQLTARLPSVRGREQWASLDAAALAPDGVIYGGTFDGYLFAYHPETNEVVNFGKPFRQQRIQALVFTDSRIYGVGGEEEGLPRAFSFDPKTRSFELGGTLGISGGKILLDPVGAMVTSPDGRIYIGTTGRLGNLYIWDKK